MSAADFVHMLTEVGYPHAKQLNPSDWDWMFEMGGGAGVFLNWLCRTVTADSVVSEAERAAFSRLQEVEGVLEGTRLDEALAAMEEAGGDLELEVQQLTKELAVQKSMMARVKRTRDQICNENLSLSMELSRLAERQARSARHRQRQKLAGDQLALTAARSRLSANARQLTDRLSESRAGLLSRAPLDGIEATEQRISQRLVELARRCADPAAGAAAADCSLVDLRPSRLAGDAAHSRLAAQLARLERVLPAAKLGAQCAAAQATGLRDAVQLARRLLREPAQRALLATQPVAQHVRDDELREALAAAVDRYVQGILARACIGDHANKVERQQAVLRRQAEARGAAVQQLARLEWLRRAVAAESGTVADAADTLAAAGQQAADQYTALGTRLRLMKRAAHLGSETDAAGDETAPLREMLQAAVGPPPNAEQETHRAALAALLADQLRQLRTGRRLEAALDRSGVSARCSRLERSVRGVQPELKALVRQWDERKSGRRPHDTLWMLMMTAPARLERVVVEAERVAAGEGAVAAAVGGASSS